MRTPLFSRREVLNFLIEDASRIKATSDEKCWRAVWDAFSKGAFDNGDDGPFLEFERVCQFYGFSPEMDSYGFYTMQNANLRGELA